MYQKTNVRQLWKTPCRFCTLIQEKPVPKNQVVFETHESKETVKDVMKHFDELLLISQCHCKAHRYPVIKSWFLEKYPEIEGFGKAKKEEETSNTENDSPFEEVMPPLVEERANIEPIAA